MSYKMGKKNFPRVLPEPPRRLSPIKNHSNIILAWVIILIKYNWAPQNLTSTMITAVSQWCLSGKVLLVFIFFLCEFKKNNFSIICTGFTIGYKMGKNIFLGALPLDPQGDFVTLQTQKSPKHEKNISKIPVDFVHFDNLIQVKSYQVPTSRIIIIIPLNILQK